VAMPSSDLPVKQGYPQRVDDRLYVRMCRLVGGFPSIREVRNQRGEPRLTPHIIPASFT